MTDMADGPAPRGAVLVPGMPETGGVHCETTALGALLGHTGVELSEAMLFGLGAGLSFIYWDSKRQPVPFLGGRVKPFELTRNLARRLGLDLQVRETTSAHRAWEQARAPIDAGVPVGLQLDSHHLEYFGSAVHFAGHVVALYGYDATTAYLLDTAQQGGRVSTGLQSLARARAARGPMSAPHRSFTFSTPSGPPDVRRAIVPSLVECAEAFLSPPIANIGCRGIATTARRIVSWLGRVDDPRRDLPTIAMLMERGGTGGALFRNLYRDFLDECLPLLDGAGTRSGVEQARGLFEESGRSWTRVAGHVESAGATGDVRELTEAAALLARIAEVETGAMSVLRAL